MTNFIIILNLIYLFIFTYCVIEISIYVSKKYKFLAKPEKRSSHKIPTPTIGGIGFVLAIIGLSILKLIFARDYMLLFFISGGILISIVGLFDDTKGMNSHVKLILQIISGILPALILFKLSPIQHPALFVFVVFWIVFIENVINFMDGTNGLVGSFGIYSSILFLFLIITLLNTAKENYLIEMLVCLIIGLIAFLIYNITPAKTFMGDTGSQFLGYIFGLIPIYISIKMKSIYPFITSLIILMPFVYDVIYTLILRIKKKENIFKAHKDHLYQRLVKSKYSHNKVLIINILLFLICGIIAIINNYYKNEYFQIFLLTLSLIIMFVYTTFVKVREKNN